MPTVTQIDMTEVTEDESISIGLRRARETSEPSDRTVQGTGMTHAVGALLSLHRNSVIVVSKY